ncbi:MAG: hypothetical protein H8E25_09755 [Planctomycetes bacterium]|nr:hypothetical protein [Planctomycetota bacterium]
MRLNLAYLILPAALILGASANAQTVGPGDSPSYAFEQAYNSMGSLKSLDFLGKPVFIEFWGTR